jgi:hypothetical protein
MREPGFRYCDHIDPGAFSNVRGERIISGNQWVASPNSEDDEPEDLFGRNIDIEVMA